MQSIHKAADRVLALVAEHRPDIIMVRRSDKRAGSNHDHRFTYPEPGERVAVPNFTLARLSYRGSCGAGLYGYSAMVDGPDAAHAWRGDHWSIVGGYGEANDYGDKLSVGSAVVLHHGTVYDCAAVVGRIPGCRVPPVLRDAAQGAAGYHVRYGIRTGLAGLGWLVATEALHSAGLLAGTPAAWFRKGWPVSYSDALHAMVPASHVAEYRPIVFLAPRQHIQWALLGYCGSEIAYSVACDRAGPYRLPTIAEVVRAFGQGWTADSWTLDHPDSAMVLPASSPRPRVLPSSSVVRTPAHVAIADRAGQILGYVSARVADRLRRAGGRVFGWKVLMSWRDRARVKAEIAAKRARAVAVKRAEKAEKAKRAVNNAIHKAAMQVDRIKARALAGATYKVTVHDLSWGRPGLYRVHATLPDGRSASVDVRSYNWTDCGSEYVRGSWLRKAPFDHALAALLAARSLPAPRKRGT